MIDPNQIPVLYEERKKDRGPLLARWSEITMSVDGEVHVPVAELDENDKATVVNLLPIGLDQMSMRAGSVYPQQTWPAVRENIEGSQKKARERLQAGMGWWRMNAINLIDRQRLRYHFGYGCMPVSLSPVGLSPLDKREIPHWRARNPMCTFPSHSDDSLDIEPVDVIYSGSRSRKWLQTRYPACDWGVGHPDDKWTVLEYNDCDVTILVACGRVAAHAELWTPHHGGAMTVLLEVAENRAGMPLIVHPGRISLGRVAGALDQMLPGYRKAAKLDALNLLAITRSIFPEQWVVSHPGDPQAPQVVQEANGIMGRFGEIAHGTILTIGNNPASAQVAAQALDGLERQQRLAGGVSAEMGGESPTNVRTARRGADVLGSQIDMPIQETQEILERSKEAELHRAVAIEKGWWGPKSVSFYIPRGGMQEGDKGDYTPDKTFECDDVIVKYPMPGVDAASIPIELGQRVNTGVLSLQTSRELDPLVDDADEEGMRVDVEGVRHALLTSLEQGAQQGSLDPATIAMMVHAFEDDPSAHLEDVVSAVHKKMQAQQAAAPQLPPGSPDAQPGLAPAGTPGAPPTGGSPAGGQPPSPFSGPPSSQALAQIMGNLKGGNVNPGATPPAPNAPPPGQ